MKYVYILLVALLGISCISKKEKKGDGHDAFVFEKAQLYDNGELDKKLQVVFSYQALVGLEAEGDVTRRDPSDVIFANSQYYLWYTKTDKTFSGYDASIWYAVSKDGKKWEEKGEAIPRGDKGSWDAYSVFTPNVLKAKGKYYLFYTGVKPTPGNQESKFENNSSNDITALGLVVSNSPDGPFKRVSESPILQISQDIDKFDSYRIDDACIVYRDAKYWLYYKGRSAKYGSDGPSHTKMGVAVSHNPEGPYVKYKNNPLTNGGHEVMVWPYDKGVMTMLSSHGEDGRTLQYAEDGVSFSIVGKFNNDYPKAPGAYRVDDFKGVPHQSKNISWGISMHYGNRDQNIWPHLVRYEIKFSSRPK